MLDQMPDQMLDDPMRTTQTFRGWIAQAGAKSKLTGAEESGMHNHTQQYL